MEDAQFRTAMRTMYGNFRRHRTDLSGEQLDLEWSRLCSSLASGPPPEQSRTASWTPEWPGGPQVTVRATTTSSGNGTLD